jgi:HK97 family phage portal protein
MYFQSVGRETVPLSPPKRAISYAEIYEDQTFVHAAVNKLYRQISALPLRVYRKLDNGEREEVRDGSLNTLLEKPAPSMNAFNLKQWVSKPLFIHGNALIAKYRGNGSSKAPTELLPMRWPDISAWARPGSPVVETWGTGQTGEERTIDAGETVHVAWLDGESQVGVSPLKPLAKVVRLEDSVRRFQVSSFDNAARPGSALIPPEGFQYQQGQREELRQEIRETHGGVDQAMKMALLAPGFDVKPLSYSAQEAELIAQRQLSREEVAAVYDLPGPLIGDLTHGTYSNVEELHKQLYKTTLPPHLGMIAGSIQAQLIDPEPEWQGLFVEFDISEQLKGDPRDHAEAIRLQVEAGLLTRNEGRRRLNLPPVDEPMADELFANVNNQAPLSRAQEIQRGEQGRQLPPAPAENTPDLP